MESQSQTTTVEAQEESRSKSWLFILLGIVTILSGFVYSMQPAFYPIEAQRKHVSLTEVGIVVGIYELVTFLVSPLIGTFMGKTGPTVALYWGIFLTAIGISGIGLLDFVQEPVTFFVLSIILRLIQAVGATSRVIAITTMVTVTFKDAIGSSFAAIESFFGFGMCGGVFIAGYLMELVGFKATFVATGFVLLATVPVTALVFRVFRGQDAFCKGGTFEQQRNSSNSNNGDNGPTVFRLLRVPSIALSAFGIVATAISVGFTYSNLEPYLYQQFKLPPSHIGLMFLARDLSETLACPLLGILFDKIDAQKAPVDFRLVGPIFIAASFSLLAAPFIPGKPTIGLAAVGLVLLGVGTESTFVSSFLFALQDAKAQMILVQPGAEEDIRLNELISGIWRSAISLGLFTGSVIAGALYDVIGFRNEALLIIGLQIFHVLLIAICTCFRNSNLCLGSGEIVGDERAKLLKESEPTEED